MSCLASKIHCAKRQSVPVLREGLTNFSCISLPGIHLLSSPFCEWYRCLSVGDAKSMKQPSRKSCLAILTRLEELVSPLETRGNFLSGEYASSGH